MSKRLSRRAERHSRRRKGDTRDLADRLAPLEELGSGREKSGVTNLKDGSADVIQEHGAIVVGNGKPIPAKNLGEVESRNGILGIEPIVLIIAGLMLGFIAVILWLVSQMPPQP